ncbi:MAG: hypothetical protein JXO22_14080 [Phycisphaerae bacterium]|nr:hypothetical protein [Phycisphaerae bacterium]
MELNRRKLAVGLIVFGALVLVYLAYIRLGGAGRIDLTPRDQLGDAMLTGSAVRYDTNATRIAGAEVGAIQQTVFVHQTDGVVDREFGFDTLLPQKGDQWKVTKPYMRLFMSGFRCHVTADEGEVQCETSGGGRPIPDDAMFSGHVVIHVIPNDPNEPVELFIYLDDVAFVADQSLFSTAGPIKFVSRVAQLVGRGMELIYDEGRNRLELFRIRELESLRARSADLKLLTDKSRRGQSPAADSNQPVEPHDPNTVVLTAGDASGNETSDGYECVFWKNVRIETPEQIVVARQWLAVNNILWSGRQTVPPAPAGPAAVSTTATVAGPNEPNTPEIVPYPGPNALDTKPSKFIALSALPESSFDIVVTCDGGFVVGPKGVGTSTIDPNAVAAATDSDVATETPPTDPNHQMLFAEWIDVNAVTSNVELAGPVQIGFALDPNLLAGREPSGALMPVTVTAQKVVRYLAAINQVRFEGDCVATVRQTIEMSNTVLVRDEYALRAPILTLDLAEDPNAPRDKVKVKYVAAFGGPISFHGLRQADDETVGWVKLDGSRLDCNLPDGAFLVTGPGTISVHSTVAADPNAARNEFTLDGPFYALMSDFKRLTYSAVTQRIVAESDERIQLGYLPIREDGSYGPAVNADAGHIEVALTQTADDRMELAGLTASRGITYEDDKQRFAGSVLTYDHALGLVHVTGDDAQPCYLNGFLVDQIEMNVSTGSVKTQFEAPGTLLVK